MRGYLSYFKTELLVGLQYKISALSGLTTQFFWGIIHIFVYIAFYSHTNISSITLKELICYVWLTQSFFSLVYLNIKDKETLESIKNGTVAYELCRPYDLYTWWYIKHLAKRIANVTLRSIPLLTLAFVLPQPYGMDLPISTLSFILFILSLMLGAIIITSINIIIETLSFFTMQDKGVSSIFYTVGDLLSGFILPIPLLPTIVVMITEYLPFRLIGDLSFRIYSGNILIPYAIKSILLQIVWIIALIVIGKLLMKKALKKVSIQGG